MQSLLSLYDRLIAFASSRIVEVVTLLAARLALAGIFWFAYKTKVVEGTWFEIDEFQYVLFENDFAGLPLAPDLAVPLATYAEFFFPILLAFGLATRFAALALMIMALVIQIFVFPTAQHFFGWAITPIALALVILSRGPGPLSIDAFIASRRTT